MTRVSNYPDVGVASGFVKRLDVPSSAIVNKFRIDTYETKKGSAELGCACDQFGNVCLYHWYYEMKPTDRRNGEQPHAQQAQSPEQARQAHRSDSGELGHGTSADDRRRGHSSVRGDSPQPEIRSPRRSKRRQ